MSWGRPMAGVAIVLLVAGVGACSSGDGDSDGGGDGGGSGGRTGSDDRAVAMVLATGDVVAALQDERRATQAALLGLPDQPGRPVYDAATEAVDQAFLALDAEVERLGPIDYVKAEPEATGVSALAEGLRGPVAGALTVGREEALENDLAGEFDPLVRRILVIQRRFADDVDDPVVEVYTQTSQMIEALIQVAGVAVSQGAEWASEVDPYYQPAIDAWPELTELARDTDLAAATTALDDTLAETAFGNPPTGTPDDFITTLSVDAWRSYRDVARQHLLQR